MWCVLHSAIVLTVSWTSTKFVRELKILPFISLNGHTRMRTLCEAKCCVLCRVCYWNYDMKYEHVSTYFGCISVSWTAIGKKLVNICMNSPHDLSFPIILCMLCSHYTLYALFPLYFVCSVPIILCLLCAQWKPCGLFKFGRNDHLSPVNVTHWWP